MEYHRSSFTLKALHSPMGAHTVACPFGTKPVYGGVEAIMDHASPPAPLYIKSGPNTFWPENRRWSFEVFDYSSLYSELEDSYRILEGARVDVFVICISAQL